MAVDRWCVVLVRAWVEGGQLRVRMLETGDRDDAVMYGSVSGASVQLATWLGALVDDAPNNAE